MAGEQTFEVVPLPDMLRTRTKFVAAFMIAEIVSNGMLTLPNAMAVVGMIPETFGVLAICSSG